ncbi:MAG: hypothetical protein ABI882_22170, partial [Acidobacteriota bacterium]
MMYQNQLLGGLIKSVRQRRLLITILKGAAVVLAVAVVVLLALGYLAYRLRGNAGALVSLRIASVMVFVPAVYFFLVRPLRRWASDSQIARLVEERHPGLDDRLVSAIEFAPEAEIRSSAVVNRLVDDANRSAAAVNPREVVPQSRIWQYGGLAAALLAVCIGTLLFGPREVTQG